MGGGVLVVAVALLLRPGGDVSLCEAVTDLLVDAETGFVDIQSDLVEAAAGEWSVDRSIDAASWCSLMIDPERAGYLCSWEFPAGDQGADNMYGKSVDVLGDCVGKDTAEHTDASVNHPDYYDSTYFTADGTEVSVSLKNKSVLGKIFVSVGVDQVG